MDLWQSIDTTLECCTSSKYKKHYFNTDVYNFLLSTDQSALLCDSFRQHPYENGVIVFVHHLFN